MLSLGYGIFIHRCLSDIRHSTMKFKIGSIHIWQGRSQVIIRSNQIDVRRSARFHHWSFWVHRLCGRRQGVINPMSHHTRTLIKHWYHHVSTSHLWRHCRPSNGGWELNFLSAAINPSVSNNYRAMVLCFAAFALRHDSCLSFLLTYLFAGLPCVAYISFTISSHECSEAFRSRPWTTWPYHAYRLYTASRITYVIMHSVVTGTAPEYISDMFSPVSTFQGRVHLRSATLGLYDVPRTRILIGSKAFVISRLIFFIVPITN